MLNKNDFPMFKTWLFIAVSIKMESHDLSGKHLHNCANVPSEYKVYFLFQVGK